MMSGLKMPVLFIGHGSPMNAIEDNKYTRNWVSITDKIPRPKVILSISAHWYTQGSRISDELYPKTVYDMYGFPDELYRVKYHAAGSPETANLVKRLIARDIKTDNSWGIDHGSWSVLCKMYPDADIPLLQLSVDRNAAPEVHFQMGRELSSLREQGVLIMGSGNIVHNLAEVGWGIDGGYPWAEEFDLYVKDKIIRKQYRDVIRYENAGSSAALSCRSPDHFYPLLYVLGAA
ncbi:MAG: 4,5-DOPA dioxygenase extradiol, partial [Oscillospiraceae bacterium]